jgi:hypothetical protein
MWKKRETRGRLIANRKENGRRYILMAQVRLSFSFDTTNMVVVILSMPGNVLWQLQRMKKKRRTVKHHDIPIF